MKAKFKNSASTTLSTAINTSQTSITVSNASVFPSINSANNEYFVAVISSSNTNYEIVKVTEVNLNNNTLTIARNQEDSTAKSFSSGALISNRITAGSLQELVGSVDFSSTTGSIVVSPSVPSGGFEGQIWMQYDDSSVELDGVWPNLIAAGTETEGGICVGSYFHWNIWYALIVAPTATGESTKQWKTTANASAAGSQSLVDGWTNTNSNNDASHPAFEWVRSLNIGGFTDWYVPAKDELSVMYINKSILTAAYTFAATFYWSSTENSSVTYYSWFQNMSVGDQTSTNKTNNYRVRAVRRLAL
jgi:hypothetical protein